MDIINHLIDAYNIPILTAFLIGLLTSISPCPLATNITAIAFISKDVKSSRATLFNGLLYTLGRAVSYTSLTVLMYFGLSSFQVSRIFQGWSDKVLGPVFIILGLVMFGVIKINIPSGNHKLEKFKSWVATKGYLGPFLLGVLLAFAFCPYSGVLFFGVLTPLILKSKEAFLLPSLFAIGTGIPVIFFSFIIAFSMQKMSLAFAVVAKIEKVTRYIVSITFLAVGIYYTRYLIIYLLSL